MISLEINMGVVSRDPTIDRSNVGNSSTRPSEQAAISGTNKELATSLVEMKISLDDLPMKEAPTSKEGDA